MSSIESGNVDNMAQANLLFGVASIIDISDINFDHGVLQLKQTAARLVARGIFQSDFKNAEYFVKTFNIDEYEFERVLHSAQGQIVNCRNELKSFLTRQTVSFDQAEHEFLSYGDLLGPTRTAKLAEIEGQEEETKDIVAWAVNRYLLTLKTSRGGDAQALEGYCKFTTELEKLCLGTFLLLKLYEGKPLTKTLCFHLLKTLCSNTKADLKYID